METSIYETIPTECHEDEEISLGHRPGVFPSFGTTTEFLSYTVAGT